MNTLQVVSRGGFGKINSAPRHAMVVVWCTYLRYIPPMYSRRSVITDDIALGPSSDPMYQRASSRVGFVSPKDSLLVGDRLNSSTDVFALWKHDIETSVPQWGKRWLGWAQLPMGQHHISSLRLLVSGHSGCFVLFYRTVPMLHPIHPCVMMHEEHFLQVPNATGEGAIRTCLR